MAIINEENARIAKQLSSFSDYVEGSATASYNAQCAEAAAILEQVKPKCATADQRERAEWLYNRYCAVLAEAINRENEIGTRCPSVLICGPANFPVRKKEKQVAAWDTNRENFRKADHYLQMLKRAHTLAVKSDDPEALDYLRAKLDQLQTAHQTMKDANAYYRKHKTLDGCPGVTAKERACRCNESLPACSRSVSALRPRRVHQMLFCGSHFFTPFSVALVLPISSHRGTIATERRCKNEPVVN